MYLKKTWEYGNRIEVKKYHTLRYGIKGEKREKRKKPTPEKMALANERAAKRKLMRLMIGNFKRGDWHLTLTYTKEKRPSVEESKKILKQFFKRLRRVYKLAGAELKYIIVTEWQGKALHHHLAINNIPGFSENIVDIWTHGGIHLTPLYPNQDYAGLAEYFVKETSDTFRKKDNPYKQRWSCSRNLKKPKEKVEVVKANCWRDDVVVPKKLQAQGYSLMPDSVVQAFDAWGYPYQTYTFICYASRGRGTERGAEYDKYFSQRRGLQ